MKEEIDFNLPLKAVKKTTYNGIINQARLNINLDNSAIKQLSLVKSQSFKNITKFVPKLMPKKSTFVPTPLKLNEQIFILKKEKEDNEKQLSENEIEIIDNDSSLSSVSSSDVEKSSEEELVKDKSTDKEIIGVIFKNNSCNLIEKIESKKEEDDCDSLYLNEIKEQIEPNDDKNMKILRKKMSQIKAKVAISKFKETEEIIHDNFKNNFDMGIKKYEKEENYNSIHASINIFVKNNVNTKAKSKSIFEVISQSKQSIKQ